MLGPLLEQYWATNWAQKWTQRLPPNCYFGGVHCWMNNYTSKGNSFQKGAASSLARPLAGRKASCWFLGASSNVIKVRSSQRLRLASYRGSSQYILVCSSFSRCLLSCSSTLGSSFAIALLSAHRDKCVDISVMGLGIPRVLEKNLKL